MRIPSYTYSFPFWMFTGFVLLCLYLLSGCREDWDLQTISFPEVHTLEQIEYNELPTQIKVCGEISGMKDETASVNEHGFIWAMSDSLQHPLDLNTQRGLEQKLRANNGPFCYDLTGLTPGVAYDYSAYAIYNGKEIYGEQRTFIAGIANLQLDVSAVEVLVRSSAGSSVLIHCQGSSVPKGLSVNTTGVFLMPHESPLNLTYDEAAYLDFPFGSVQDADENILFAVPAQELLPGYYSALPYFEINGVLVLGDPYLFSIGDFWERRPDMPELLCKVQGVMAAGKAYFSFNTSHFLDDLIIDCKWEHAPWTYSQPGGWLAESGAGALRAGGVLVYLNDTIYTLMGLQTFGSPPPNPELNSEIEKIAISSGAYSYSEIQTAPGVRGPRRLFGVTFTLGNKIYVGLGMDEEEQLVDDFWEYNPSSADPWTFLGNFPDGGLIGSVAFTLDEKAYIGLGRDAAGNHYSDIWEFDPESSGSPWTKKIAPFPGPPRVDAKQFTLHGRAYVGMGITDISYEFCEGIPTLYDGDSFKDFYAFDPLDGPNGSWQPIADFPGAGGRTQAVALANGETAFAGLGNGGIYSCRTDFYEYFPGL